MKIKSLKEGPIDVEIKQGGSSAYWWDVINYEDFGLDSFEGGVKEESIEAKQNWVRLAKLNGFENWKFV